MFCSPHKKSGKLLSIKPEQQKQIQILKKGKYCHLRNKCSPFGEENEIYPLKFLFYFNFFYPLKFNISFNMTIKMVYKRYESLPKYENYDILHNALCSTTHTHTHRLGVLILIIIPEIKVP